MLKILLFALAAVLLSGCLAETDRGRGEPIEVVTYQFCYQDTDRVCEDFEFTDNTDVEEINDDLNGWVLQNVKHWAEVAEGEL